MYSIPPVPQMAAGLLASPDARCSKQLTQRTLCISQAATPKTAATHMPMTVLICGSPADGFQIVGLFADRSDAESYAEDHALKDWWVARVTSPEAFAESQRQRLRAPRAHIQHRR
jgi:hypothetical protein